MLAADPIGWVRCEQRRYAAGHTADVDDALVTALGPVLADVRRSDIDVSFVLAEPPTEGAGFVRGILRADDGSETGIQIDVDQGAAEQVAALANVVQDIVVEDFLLAPWPECHLHRGSHPLLAAVDGQGAVWTCPINEAVIAPIGDLDGQ